MDKLQKFIKKAKLVHGSKYDYSMVNYVNKRTKVCIICPEHGEFWQTPSNHLIGYEGCPKCSNNNIRQRLLKDKESFIEKAENIHQGKYDYSKVDYKDRETKVCIICPEHGEFWQTPHSHLMGRGCPKCSNNEKITFETFIEKAKKKYGEKFLYSEKCYKGYNDKMKIVCPEHGEFWQTPSNHLRSLYGCPECGKEKAEENMLKTKKTFLERAKKIHKGKYDYSKTIFKTSADSAIITCPIHGDFLQRIDDHLLGHGCPACGALISIGENEIVSFIEKLSVRYERRNRKILNGREIDIFLPDYKLGIEFDGLKWHTEEFGKGKEYHLSKTEECRKQGIRLIHIFEDDWNNRKEIIQHKLLHILHKEENSLKIGGRKCNIKKITFQESKKFLDKFHIQGHASATVYLGSFYKEQLVAVMTFKRESNKSNKWELNRYATNWNYSLPGVASKMFSFFITEYKPVEIKSFLDRCWNTEDNINVYNKLGFYVENVLPPDYKYVKGMTCIHKFNFRKEKLSKKYNLPLSMTEKEMANKLKIYRIWNCGLVKYVWKNDTGR